jgi:beta-phosphoglucomutase-like phosphatase (HAD superfamily)
MTLGLRGAEPLPDLLALDIGAFLFDLDGVVTRTADVHAHAWKQLFDGFLAARAGDAGFAPFRLSEDYIAYVDGKPRYDGVRSFLESRPMNEKSCATATTGVRMISPSATRMASFSPVAFWAAFIRSG